LEDSKIISLIKDRNTQNKGFEVLIDVFKERLYWQIRRIVISHEDTDDVLQNVFIKVFRYIHTFAGNSSLFTWLYKIATNEALDFVKKKQKKGAESLGDYKDYVESTLQADRFFEGDFIQATIKKAIATLPEKQMLVFNMKYYDDMKYNEISKILDTSVGALKASYHHAVKKIENYVHEMNIHYEF